MFEVKGNECDYDYRLFFPIDSGDEWIFGAELPDKSIGFRKAHLSNPKATPAELRAAAAAVQEVSE